MKAPQLLAQRALIVVQTESGLCYGQTVAASLDELRFQADQALAKGTRCDFRLQLATWGETVVGHLEILGIATHTPGEAPTYAARLTRMGEADRRVMSDWLVGAELGEKSPAPQIDAPSAVTGRLAIGHALRQSLTRSRRDPADPTWGVGSRSESAPGWMDSLPGTEEAGPWEEGAEHKPLPRESFELSSQRSLRDALDAGLAHCLLTAPRDYIPGSRVEVELQIPSGKRIVCQAVAQVSEGHGSRLLLHLSSEQRKIIHKEAR